MSIFFMINNKRSLQPLLLYAICLCLVCVKIRALTGPESGARCIERERQALLNFKKGLVDESGRLSSWGSQEDKKECCKWIGVRCSNRTGHVTMLDLPGPYTIHGGADFEYFHSLRGNLSPSLLDLHYLSHLNLSGNNFEGIPIPKFIGSLSELRYLDLSMAFFGGTIPSQLGNLSKLRYADLSTFYERLEVENLYWLSNLSFLTHLDMSYVNLSTATHWLDITKRLPSLSYVGLESCSLSPITSSSHSLINSSTSIATLNLSGNHFTSSMYRWLFNISSSLVHLDVSWNQLEDPIPDEFASLSHLDLSNNDLRGPIPDAFGNIASLTHLDLSLNDLKDRVLDAFGNSTSLVHLNLFENQLEGPIPETFGNISSLLYLNLMKNHLEGTIPASFGNFCNLQIVYLNSNNFSGNLDFLHKMSSCAKASLESLVLYGNKITGSLPDLTGLPYLKLLDLEANKLDGFLPRKIGQCSDLVLMILSKNQIKGPLPDLTHCSSLREFHLNHNKLYGSLPNFTGLSSLTKLHLDYNELNGSFPDFTGCTSLRELHIESNRIRGNLSESIGQLSMLEYFNVSSNSLDGVISEVHLFNLTRLKSLDLSFNPLSFDLHSQWVSPFQLDHIDMHSCKLGPRFPSWIQTQTNYSYLDFSNNELSDAIPMWFWDLPARLNFLNLSFNKIRGMLPDLSSIAVRDLAIDLSFNNFEGPIPLLPSGVKPPGFYPYGLTSLNLAGNKFFGAITFLCAITDGVLTSLDLSYNLLSGELPDCWGQFKYLIILSLAGNKLSGKIPSSMGFLVRIETLDLQNNSFSGELPLSLKNCTALTFLNLGYNNLAGNVPAWIGENLSQLYVLILRSNKFYGSIPLHICHLTNLQLLDLSMNDISGPIPQCFNNFTVMVHKEIYFEINRPEYVDRGFHHVSGFGVTYRDSALIGWKGRELEFENGLRLVKGIDLASNKLTGEIPDTITDILGMVALNLSRNELFGTVPPNIGQLKLIQSLDLSRNRLSGGIPTSLSGLNFLSYLDLSYNKFSGRIPLGTQLQGFNASQYTGNNGLCGPPLTPQCPGDEAPQVQPTIVANKDEDEFDKWFYIGTALGSVIGFWGICVTLLLNRQRRHAYFILLDNLGNWLYVNAAVNIAKLRRDKDRNQ